MKSETPKRDGRQTITVPRDVVEQICISMSDLIGTGKVPSDGKVASVLYSLKGWLHAKPGDMVTIRGFPDSLEWVKDYCDRHCKGAFCAWWHAMGGPSQDELREQARRAHEICDELERRPAVVPEVKAKQLSLI